MTPSNPCPTGDAWLDRLKAAVDAGYYRTECAESEQEPLPWHRATCAHCPFWRAGTCLVLLHPRAATDHTCSYFDHPNRAAAQAILDRRTHPGHWWEDFFANRRGM